MGDLVDCWPETPKMGKRQGSTTRYTSGENMKANGQKSENDTSQETHRSSQNSPDPFIHRSQAVEGEYSRPAQAIDDNRLHPQQVDQRLNPHFEQRPIGQDYAMTRMMFQSQEDQVNQISADSTPSGANHMGSNGRSASSNLEGAAYSQVVHSNRPSVPQKGHGYSMGATIDPNWQSQYPYTPQNPHPMPHFPVQSHHPNAQFSSSGPPYQHTHSDLYPSYSNAQINPGFSYYHPFQQANLSAAQSSRHEPTLHPLQGSFERTLGSQRQIRQLHPTGRGALEFLENAQGTRQQYELRDYVEQRVENIHSLDNVNV